ncbi:MAG: DUF222 domain-containing protein [Mycobacterium sp.]
MFDDLPDSATAADLDDNALAAAIEVSTRATATVAAHRFAFIAELHRRRYNSDWETDEDACDAWTSVVAEISCASGTSHYRAESDMVVGADLSTRLPGVAALLMAGQISEYLARTIVKRTELVMDRELLAKIDAGIADTATQWGALSKKKLDAAIDFIVDEHDPGALKRTRKSLRDRKIWFGESKDGVTEFAGVMDSLDAALVQQRITLMAKGVCKDDPRTLAQRRVDAYGALGAGSFHLQCRCGSPTCPASADDGRASNVVVHIYGDESTLAAEPDPFMDGDGPLPTDGDVAADDDAVVAQPDPIPDDDGPLTADDDDGVSDEFSLVSDPIADGDGPLTADDEATTSSENAVVAQPGSSVPTPTLVRAPAPTPVRPRGGFLPGFGIVPAALLANKIAQGAKVRYLQPPGDAPEAGYGPLTALDEWVRSRDLTCRFPNCDVPAALCDLDHTVAHGDGGPTHASNLSADCRNHHLMKTFRPGWSDVQYPDGTIVWTTPSGRTYTTKPGSSLFFPAVNTTSALIVPGTPRPNSPDKLQLIPKRKRSRAKERAYRINAERALNDAHVAENNNPPF